jgi:hypothetical protein
VPVRVGVHVAQNLGNALREKVGPTQYHPSWYAHANVETSHHDPSRNVIALHTISWPRRSRGHERVVAKFALLIGVCVVTNGEVRSLRKSLA